MMSDIINEIKESPTKIPLVLFIFPIILILLGLLECILGLFQAYDLFYTIDSSWNFFDVMARISYFVIGAYLILLYSKEKNILYAAAGVAFIIRSLIHFYIAWFAWGQQLLWLICGITMALPAFRDEEHSQTGKTAIILACAYFIFIGIFAIINRNYYYYIPEWLMWLFRMIIDVTLLAEHVYLLACLVEYSRSIGSTQELLATATAGMSAAKEQISNLSNNAKEQFSDVTTRVTGSETETVTDTTPVAADGSTLSSVVPGTVSDGPHTSVHGGRQYKTVAGPVGLTISNKDSYSKGVQQYASIVDAESVGGWQLDSVRKIPVIKKSGCLGSLLGRTDETVYFNMLIFYKDE